MSTGFEIFYPYGSKTKKEVQKKQKQEQEAVEDAVLLSASRKKVRPVTRVC